MKVIIAQHNPIIGDLQGNTEKVLLSLDSARAKGADLVLFPELTLCGYVPDDLVLHKPFIQEMEGCLDRLVRASKGIALIVGLARENPHRGDKPLLNSAAVISDGRLLGFYDKWLLPTYDVFNERRYFARGSELKIFEIKGMRVAVTICEDIWQNAGQEISGVDYPWDPVREYRAYKPDLMCNLSASPYQFGKPDVRVQVCRAVTERLNCPILYCCQVGANGALIFDGGSLVLGEDGALWDQAAFFKEDERLIDLEKPPLWKGSALDPLDMLEQALTLGIHDYLEKTDLSHVVIGLSGGVDSSLLAALAAKAVNPKQILGLFCPGKNTPPEAAKITSDLAKTLGIEYLAIPLIEEEALLAGHLSREMNHALTPRLEEGVISRLRALMLMAFAAERNALVLNAGNKTELALGLCSLYGDMAGSIAPLGDLWKSQVYELIKHFRAKGMALPKELQTTHHLELPPYSILDEVLKGYIEEYRSAEEIARFTGLSVEKVASILGRIHAAEHKRRQAAPALRVSSKAFGAGRHKPLHSRWFKGDS